MRKKRGRERERGRRKIKEGGRGEIVVGEDVV